MFTGIQKVSVYDPATGTVVQFDNIAPETEFSNEKFGDENAAGRLLYAGDNDSFEFMTMGEESGLAQIKTWMEDETPVRLVAYGLEQHLLWYEDSFIHLKKGFDPVVGKRNRHSIKIVKKGISNNILIGTNLLAMVFGWADVADNGLADNYELVGDLVGDDFTVGKVQELSTVILETGLKFRPNADLVFPVVGANLQHSVRVDALVNGAALTIRAELMNFAGGSLVNETALLSVGLKNFTTPANTYKIWLNPLYGDGSAALTADIAHPYLGVQKGAHVDIEY